MIVDDDLESQHAKVGARVFGQADLQHIVKLLVHVFELGGDGGHAEQIVLTEHFGGLFADEIFTALDEFLHLREHLAVHLLGGDVTAEARVVHHVAGFVAHVGGFRGAVVFIEDESGEELFFWHKNLWDTDHTDCTDFLKMDSVSSVKSVSRINCFACLQRWRAKFQPRFRGGDQGRAQDPC